jgi:hypothetical protein
LRTHRSSRVYMMQEPPPNGIVSSTDSSDSAGRIVSEVQPGDVLAESLSAHQARPTAFVKATSGGNAQCNRRSQPEQVCKQISFGIVDVDSIN